MNVGGIAVDRIADIEESRLPPSRGLPSLTPRAVLKGIE
jgi:hypothetical protein